MTAFITQNFVPLMFAGLLLFLISGFPVAFALIATGLSFGLLGMQLDMFGATLFQAMPLRIFGIMQNDTLLAIPFFTFMGIILERSGMAEDLLESIGQVFGPVRGGVAIAVVLVGTLLAATMGVVAAAVVSMGLISLPVMLRYGYNRWVAAGSILASGTLTQIVPPSLVLIVLADQLGRTVGEMYEAALYPALLLVGVYLLFIILLAIFKPSWVPSLPPQARIYREPNGKSGHVSLLILFIICAVSAYMWSQVHGVIINPLIEREGTTVAGDELVIGALTAGSLLALVLAIANHLLKLNLLSQLTEKVVFSLLPTLVLIFLVLGTIFLGVATPTEGGAMGALGALILAAIKRRLSSKVLVQALESTTRLATFVLFVLIGATFFSFTFNAADGHVWVEHLFDKIPGGKIGFLVVVNLLVFVLGMFIDFFEIAFIVVPLLAPIAEKLGIDLVWFGIILAMNLQTSFLSPPFGFALMYLRSVAPTSSYEDKTTGKTIAPVTTMDIYKGAFMFIVLQVIMIVVVVAFPSLVSSGLNKETKLDDAAVEQMLNATPEPDAPSEETPPEVDLLNREATSDDKKEDSATK